MMSEFLSTGTEFSLWTRDNIAGYVGVLQACVRQRIEQCDFNSRRWHGERKHEPIDERTFILKYLAYI